ncbi:MAG: hypothetical protein OEW67_03410 [Cyclobacteriaceae bacterium]|nr:hypothetical protein [Cyclobacteriaceae bacterium]
MKNFIGLLFIIIIFSCSGNHNEQEVKMFEIANRQMEFNDFKVLKINGLVESNDSVTTTHLDIVKNCNEFHKNILEFQVKIKDLSINQKELRTEINNYLDRFLQEVNPELSHESYLDGAISRGLLAIELSYIEKSFLDEQEHKANQ